MARYIDVEKAEYPYLSMSMFGINSKDCKIYNEGVKATEDMIQALPTADVEEVRHGRWMPQILLGQRVWDCSECKTLGSPQWKRCPVCEAKMDGGKAE